MIDGFLKQFGPYKLCAAQSAAILAYHWRQGQNQNYQMASANLILPSLLCALEAYLIYCVYDYNSVKTFTKELENIQEECQSLMKQVNELLALSGKDTTSQSKQSKYQHPYVSPFTAQAVTSLGTAALYLIFEEKTPDIKVFALCSAIIAAVSLYNKTYHDPEAASKKQ